MSIGIVQEIFSNFNLESRFCNGFCGYLTYSTVKIEAKSSSKWSISGKNEDWWCRSSHGKSSMDKSSRIYSSVWTRSGNVVVVELDIESDSSWIPFIGSVSVEEGLESDCTAWYEISNGLKGIMPSNESNSKSEDTIQGSSNIIIFDKIMWIVAIEGDMLGGGKEKVPSKPESLIKPTPTSL